MTENKSILLLTPFRDPTFGFYKSAISSFCSQLQLNWTVLETGKPPGELVDALYASAHKAGAVIAVLDGKRPNVMYEIGFVQALGHQPICVSDSANCLSAFIQPTDIIRHHGRKDELVKHLAETVPVRMKTRSQWCRERFQLGDNIDEKKSGLVETLARTVHQRWAEQRIEEGWSYGSRRKDSTKTHPGLVDYSDLSESEKEYDRQTALATLNAIIRLGYRIEQ